MGQVLDPLHTNGAHDGEPCVPAVTFAQLPVAQVAQLPQDALAQQTSPTQKVDPQSLATVHSLPLGSCAEQALPMQDPPATH